MAVAIKSSIDFNKLIINGIKFVGTFVQTEVMVYNSRKKIMFGSIYIPCNFPTSDIYDGLDKILNFSRNFDSFVLGGDLNAKSPAWRDQTDNPNGRVLNSWLLDHTLDVLRISDSSPSFPNGSSYLDHFLIGTNILNNDLPNFNVSSLPTFSDHFPIKIDLQLDHFDFVLRCPRYFTSFKKTNWDNFRNDLDISTISIMPPEDRNLQNTDIDQLITEFTAIVNTVTNSHSEEIEVKRKVYISAKIKKFFHIKHRWQKALKKIYHRTGNRLSSEYNILSKQINLLKIIIKELIPTCRTS